MYGLVNKAIEDLVCSQFGEDTWNEILDKAGVKVDLFISMDSYPDDITYQLVNAASEILKLEPAQVLQAFGGHWTLYTVQEGYGDMLAMFGSNFKEFLFNLDNLHSHIAMAFTNLRPPHFDVEEIDGGKALLLHYRSEREGLTAMIVGLVKGLAERFGEAIEITQIAYRGQDHHDIFRIDLKAS